jgi:hypothetical protein
MEPGTEISGLADEAVAGLKDDPELQLDVRRELVTHLEEEVERQRAEGSSDQESLALALKAFGSPVEVASQLLRENQKRMRGRALIRLGLRVLLVPASTCAVILMSWYHYSSTIMAASNAGIPDDAAFMILGDRTRDGKAQQQRAIWEQDPTNAVYYANYVSHLLSEHAEQGPGRSDLERELAHAERVDPGNARYKHLLAAACMRESAEHVRPEAGETNPEDVRSRSLEVHDRELLDRGFQILAQGTAMTEYRRYGTEIYVERTALLPPAYTHAEYSARFALLRPPQTKDIQSFLVVTRFSVLYAQLLVDEGRSDEAVKVLNRFVPLLRHALEDIETLMDLLIFGAIAKIGEVRISPLYDELGQPGQAPWVQDVCREIGGPVQRWQETRRADGESDAESIAKENGSILAVILAGALGDTEMARKDFSIGRRSEQVSVEHVALIAFMMVLLLIMLVLTLVTVRWRFFSNGQIIPILLLPSWRQCLTILGASICIPVMGYIAYSRFFPFAGRNYSLLYLGPRLCIELILLSALILYLSCLLSGRFIRDRCRMLEIPVPDQNRSRGMWILAGMLAGISVLNVLVFPAPESDRIPVAVQISYAAMALVIVVVFALYGIIRTVVWLRGKRGFGLYYGSLARTMIPVFAGTILILGPATTKLAYSLEYRLRRDDPILGPTEPGLSRAEYDLVERLKGEVGIAIEDFNL